jgi:hypothetical protein
MSRQRTFAAALLSAALLTGAAPAPDKEAPPAKGKLPVAQAEQAVKDYLDNLKGPAATVSPLDDASLGRALPGHVFFAVRYRQWPVAVRPPAGLRSSNVFAVGPDGKARAFLDAKGLESFFKDNLRPAKTNDQRKDAAHAWLDLAQQFHQDGFYKFERMEGATKIEEMRGEAVVSAKSVVMAGGNGTIAVRLTFGPAGKLTAATETANLIRGPRPRCQATKLLDADPVVRQIAEDDLLIMGRYAKPYLDEQRAKASPELRRAIDRLWRRIVEQDR